MTTTTLTTETETETLNSYRIYQTATVTYYTTVEATDYAAALEMAENEELDYQEYYNEGIVFNEDYDIHDN